MYISVAEFSPFEMLIKRSRWIKVVYLSIDGKGSCYFCAGRPEMCVSLSTVCVRACVCKMWMRGVGSSGLAQYGRSHYLSKDNKSSNGEDVENRTWVVCAWDKGLT